MGMFDDLVKKVSSSVGDSLGSHPDLVKGITEHLTGKESGGLSGIVNAFHKVGLGDAVKSWISRGQNLPISTEQLQQALGPNMLNNLASKAGLSLEAVGSQLTTLLPTIVDKLTPDGKIPKESSLK